MFKSDWSLFLAYWFIRAKLHEVWREQICFCFFLTVCTVQVEFSIKWIMRMELDFVENSYMDSFAEMFCSPAYSLSASMDDIKVKDELNIFKQHQQQILSLTPENAYRKWFRFRPAPAKVSRTVNRCTRESSRVLVWSCTVYAIWYGWLKILDILTGWEFRQSCNVYWMSGSDQDPYRTVGYAMCTVDWNSLCCKIQLPGVTE